MLLSAINIHRRTRSKRGHGETLREDILDAALELLLETKDIGAVSIRAVAEKVGVTPPSIYIHFKDKNELVFAVCERQFLEMDTITQQEAKKSRDPFESLKLRGKAYIKFGLEHPEHYRILFMEKPKITPEGYDPTDFANMAGFDHLIEHVRWCFDEGVFRKELDPIQVSMLLWVNVHGLTSLMISKPDFPWPDVSTMTDFLCDSLLEGLGA